jgi:hypothetical protein
MLGEFARLDRPYRRLSAILLVLAIFLGTEALLTWLGRWLRGWRLPWWACAVVIILVGNIVTLLVILGSVLPVSKLGY